MRWSIAGALILLLAAAPAAADLVLDQEDIGWTTSNGLVTFQMRFHNPDPVLSTPQTGALFSQPFGAFADNTGPIGTFDVPQIMPDSFFDVFLEVPLSSLPPTAAEILPFNKDAAAFDCPHDWHWDGNVDVIWTGPNGGGMVNAHHGTLQVCAGQGGSYIHIVTGCAGFSWWNVVGLCAGFAATLVNEDLTPAPNPLPPGWTGHIAVSAVAGTPVGTVCCFAVNFNCGGVVVPVNLCATICDCGPVSAEKTSWGSLKALFN